MAVHYPLDMMQLERALDCLQPRQQVEVDRDHGVDGGGVHGDAGERG